MSDRLRGTRVVVVGAGRSGVAAAELCRAYGAEVLVTDAAPRARIEAAATRLEAHGISLALGGHDGVDFLGAGLVVMSPGVPSFAAVEDAARAGVEVIGEIELAWRVMPDVPVVAITGSNGKSTTVTLTGELLAAAGARPFVGGNLGDPPCEFLPRPGSLAFDYNSVVLEISSFQAERIPTFRPRRAALLNVSPNHLDRYTGFEAYVAAKGNLFANQRAGDVAVVPAGDELCIAQARRSGGELVFFGRADQPEAAFAYDERYVHDRARGLRWERGDMKLAGAHNAMNVCAALALLSGTAVTKTELDPSVIANVLARFEGLGHRISRVATVAGVTFYDDSKGTNVGATVAAILGLSETRVVAILGGRDKLGSYEPLVEAMRARGRGAVLIGEAADRIADALGDAVAITRADNMDDAVERARAMAQPGDAVLLSPACSSFDMFRDYKQRGEAFVAAVRRIEAADKLGTEA
ncbi:MAG: UDP-N-acetylmuramoyl-L-alanine--D-glutamate ligase [Polyangiaceae bacterium]